MIHLAFLWHFHQPSYHDARRNLLRMPWVRLHGVKDYTGMALLLEEFPAIRGTANFSPGLLDQLLAYGQGASDTLMLTVRKSPEARTGEDRAFLRHNLFLVPERQIAKYLRYAELREKMRGGADFDAQDWLDLETLHSLVWFHPLLVERDETVRALAVRGRDFTSQERDSLLERHRALLSEVIPRWRRLQEAGNVEIAVSPYYHPILPLLCDFESAKRAMPDTPRPSLGKTLAPDAEVQTARARQRAAELFGRAPAGTWPSEGSVSPETMELLRSSGFRWFATDQAILEKSGGGDLFRPHPVRGMTGVFRHAELSNLPGFVYKSWNPRDAAADFIRRVEALTSETDQLVVVALDGENAWEHYEENAVPFFRELYRGLSSHPVIRTVTISEGIAKVAAGEPIADLWSGSWIGANFAIWMGHEEDRRAWDLLAEVRRRLGAPRADAAWDSLYRAEGSDWFWWFGEDYSSAQDPEFDAIFRAHLANACAYAGVDPPENLSRPVRR